MKDFSVTAKATKANVFIRAKTLNKLNKRLGLLRALLNIREVK